MFSSIGLFEFGVQGLGLRGHAAVALRKASKPARHMVASLTHEADFLTPGNRHLITYVSYVSKSRISLVLVTERLDTGTRTVRHENDIDSATETLASNLVRHTRYRG